ncbi:MAG: 16S rRNA (cytidine(1402)-2'-O)-methyltransferase [Myxococcales bacterium]|nr:16S rRNA (cytidine(1402)-2'-O)-methyltransferase [Myxococcales bacterium]
MPGAALYLVATPLGNLQDLSPRAAELLRVADVLYAEDTRTAARLLSDLGLGRPLHSCFDANEAQRADEVAQHFAAGRTVALCSEAGTPGVSDPGYRMVRAAIAAGVPVVPVPGPSAVLAALVGSGLATDRFYFGGFLPRKPGPRREALAQLKTLPATLVFFESPMRTAETLHDMAEVFGPREAVVARELTKTHEEFVRGALETLAARYENERPLGEITLVVAGAPEHPAVAADADLHARALALLSEGHSPKDAAARLAFESGVPKRQAYACVLACQEARTRPAP